MMRGDLHRRCLGHRRHSETQALVVAMECLSKCRYYANTSQRASLNL